jgi:hypothetical protein
LVVVVGVDCERGVMVMMRDVEATSEEVTGDLHRGKLEFKMILIYTD